MDVSKNHQTTDKNTNKYDNSQFKLLRKIKEDKKLIQLLTLVIIIKLSILFIIFLSYNFMEFNQVAYVKNFHYPENTTIKLQTAYKTWDAQHYLYLAEEGYAPNQMSNAFYPLFPFIIKVFRPLFFGNTLISGLFLSNIFSIIGLIFFYLFVKELFNSEIAFRSSLLFLAFPTCFYTSLVYTESLFFLIIILLFYYLYQNRFLPTIILTFLLPLSRAQGILIVVPLFIFFLFRKINLKKTFSLPKKCFLFLSLIVGFIINLIIIKLTTGSYFAAFEAQKYFIGDYSILNIFNIYNWFIKNFINITFTLHEFSTSIINRIFFFFFIIALYFIYKYLDRTMFTYSLVIGLIPAFAGDFMSYPRYLVMVFPIFIASAIKLKKNYYIYLALFMMIIQIRALVSHSLYYWVA